MTERGPRGTSRWSVAVLIVTLAATLMTVVPAPPAQAAWFVPRFVRAIGGNGRPGVFAWGIAYDPVTHEMLVGDYLNNQIRRFTTDGQSIGEFWRSSAVGQPYSIAVDPNDGSVYVAEFKDNPVTYAIAKYDKNGNFLFSFQPRSSSSIQYQVWLTVDDQGHLWALDSHYWNSSSFPPRVVRYVIDDANKTVSRWDQFTITPPGFDVARMYGIDVSSDGVVWMSDAWNGVVHRYQYVAGSNSLTYLNSFGGQWLGLDNRGVAVNDATGRVYVVDATHSDVDIFDADDQSHIGNFGGEGNDPGEFAGGGRQVTLDAQGNVWVADYGNVRAEKFDPDGNLILVAPDPPRPAAQGFFAEPRDVDINDQTGEVYVADSFNQRFQRFTGGGVFEASYGQRGPHLPYGQNYPRGIGVDEAHGYLWVANERGHHYKVYTLPTSPNADPQFVSYVGDPLSDDTSPGHLRWPNDVEFWNGRAFTADRVSNRVKIFDATTFTELQSISRSSNRGLAIDPATGNLYILRQPSSSSGAIYKYVLDGSGQYVPDTNFGVGIRCTSAPCGYVGSSGSGAAKFTAPHDAVVVNGTLYVSDDAQSRLSAFDLAGNFLGSWGGSYASGPYDFKNPSGLAADPQGHLYVTDAGNDRIVVYDTTQSKAATEGVRPALSIASPASGAVLLGAPIRYSGTATDNQQVAVIDVAVQDRDSSKWWNGAKEVWQTAKYFNVAAWTGSATSADWSWYFNGVGYGGRYHAEVRVRDASGNANSPLASVNVSVVGGQPPVDTGPPETDIAIPIPGQELSPGPAALSGGATDNVALASAEVSLKDTGSGLWWNGSSWTSSAVWLPATLDAPGSASSGWSFGWSADVGTYSLSARSTDTSANVDPTPASVSFSVVAPGTPDTVPPDSQVTFPTAGQTVTAGPVTFQGTATDQRGVASVDIGIRNAAGQWWNASTNSWQGTFRWNSGTVLTSPGGASTSWSLSFTAGTTGQWVVTTRARDLTGNLEPTPRPWITFNVA
jgi:DNA-binding beta-propeller fold protein YncE